MAIRVTGNPLGTWFEVKKLFFPDRKLRDAVADKTLDRLARAGALVRTIAQRSMYRRKKKKSLPGKPPYSHVGYLRDYIAFVQSNSFLRQSVVIGPVLLPGNKAVVDTPIPGVLEYGGDSYICRGSHGHFWRERAHIRPRPYMEPALIKAWDRYIQWWR